MALRPLAVLLVGLALGGLVGAALRVSRVHAEPAPAASPAFVDEAHVAPSLTLRTLPAEVAHAWSLTASERLAVIGLSDRAQGIRAEIAQVSSTDAPLVQRGLDLAARIREVNDGSTELARDAARSRGLGDVALVQSGTSWVSAK